jgi:hypothetical protein
MTSSTLEIIARKGAKAFYEGPIGTPHSFIMIPPLFAIHLVLFSLKTLSGRHYELYPHPPSWQRKAHCKAPAGSHGLLFSPVVN